MHLAYWIFILFIVSIVWLLPIYITQQIGQAKHRTGWPWGLLLGWLGVIVVALLPKRETTDPAQP